MAEHGAGSGASRLVTGDNPLIEELETRLARLKGTEACVVFGSGYLANTGVIPTFAGKQDVVFQYLRAGLSAETTKELAKLDIDRDGAAIIMTQFCTCNDLS